MNMSMKKNRSFSSSRIALMALGISVLTACGGQSGQMGDNEFTVKEITATSSNQVTKYPATIKGLQDIEIRPQVSGFIVKLCVDEGATVRKVRRYSKSIRLSIKLLSIKLLPEWNRQRRI